MDIQSFIADSAPEAVAQIREQLGPEAVVVNVRQLPGSGLARLWQKPRIEVLALRPKTANPTPVPLDALDDLKQELSSLRQRIEEEKPPYSPSRAERAPVAPFAEAPADKVPRTSHWRVGSVLESTGLLPVHAQQVVETLTGRHGIHPPETLSQEIHLASQVLVESWLSVPVPASRDAHVFIGPPGSGKTTCLCQWLARTSLLENRACRVWRLDSQNANNAESLSVYAEILGATLERFIPSEPVPAGQTLFIDLPGVNWRDLGAIQTLAAQLRRMPQSLVHLVLNSAYETTLIFSQIRAFSSLPISDLVFTHLDEEPRWGKLWNFVLGTNYTIGCLSAGQNVPGDFHPGTPERILTRQFPRKWPNQPSITPQPAMLAEHLLSLEGRKTKP